jgi:hypothetical protein
MPVFQEAGGESSKSRLIPMDKGSSREHSSRWGKIKYQYTASMLVAQFKYKCGNRIPGDGEAY